MCLARGRDGEARTRGPSISSQLGSLQPRLYAQFAHWCKFTPGCKIAPGSKFAPPYVAFICQ